MLWRRVDRPGHEAARLRDTAAGHLLEGTALSLEPEGSCRLDYSIACDARWRTTSARIAGWIGNRDVALDLDVDSGQRWTLNKVAGPDVDGCVDVDLGFSPSTNLLPIRRLDFEAGAPVVVRAAWVRFPECVVESLEQTYERIDASTYRYASAGGRFVVMLRVNSAGFVTSYQGLWEAVGP